MTDLPEHAWLNTNGNRQTWLDRPNRDHTEEVVRADLYEALEAENARLREALESVERWWLEDEMHNHIGAPVCIFHVRAALKGDTDG